MKTLIVDTAFREGRIGLADGDKLLAEERLGEKQLESETFLALTKIGIPPDLGGIELIALAAGPGSFTGLKIGATVVKSLSYLQKIPFVGVGTLEWLAVCAGSGLILPFFRSHSDKFYWGLFDVSEKSLSYGGPDTVIEPSCSETSLIISRIAGEFNDRFIIGVTIPEVKIPSGLPFETRTIDPELSILSHLARLAYAARGSDDPLKFSPTYVAKSQAEEKMS